MANAFIQSFDIILYVILGFLIIGIILLLTIFIVLRGKYKHTFIRKVLTGDKPAKIIDKAREIYNKDSGVYYWKLLKAKHVIGRPPSQALNLTEKGNYIAEAYYLGDLNYIYSEDNLSESDKRFIELIEKKTRKEYKKGFFNKIRSDLEAITTKKTLKLARFKPSPVYIYTRDYSHLEEFKNNPTIKAYRPITTNQRLIAHDQIKKALERKNSGLMQLAYMAVPIVAMIVLISVIFIFGGELVKPIAALGDKLGGYMDEATKITQSQAALTNQLATIIENRQYIGENIGEVIRANNTAPG